MTLLSHQHYPAYDPVQLMGIVEAVDEPFYTVLCDGKAWRCRRAASCLLRPEMGDSVLISGPDPERVFLLAVIDQAQPEQSTIRVDGALRIVSSELDLTTKRGVWQVEQLQFYGAKLAAQISVTRFVGKAYEAVLDRIRSMSRHSVRITSEVDKTRAGTVDVQAEHAARVHAKFTTVTAGELVKVDGKQIHMG